MFIKIWIFASLNQNQDAYFISGGIWMPRVHAVCSVLIRGDVSINRVVCENTRAQDVLSRREQEKLGLTRWSYRWALLLWSVGKCTLWSSLLFGKKKRKRKKNLFKRSAYATEGISPQVFHEGNQRFTSQQKSKWILPGRERYLCLWGFSTAASLSFPISIISFSLPLWLLKP